MAASKPLSNAARRRAEPRIQIQLLTSLAGIGFYMQKVEVRASVAWPLIDAGYARPTELTGERPGEPVQINIPDELVEIPQGDIAE